MHKSKRGLAKQPKVRGQGRGNLTWWITGLLAVLAIVGLALTRSWTAQRSGPSRSESAPFATAPQSSRSSIDRSAPSSVSVVPMPAARHDHLQTETRPGEAPVTGTVVDALGGPVPGALLSATNTQDEVLAVATSDEAGRFRLELASGAVRVTARADGYSRQARQVEAPFTGLRLVLAAAASINGRVIAKGTLAPVADVLVTTVDAGGLRMPPRVDRSSADGTFNVRDLPPGRYSIEAASEHWRSEQRLVELGLAEVTEAIELVVEQATRVTGTVRVEGAPCEEGTLELNGPIVAYAVLHEGVARLDGVTPGRYQLSVSCEGALGVKEPIEVALTPVTRVWHLERGSEVTGVALGQNEAPLVGAHIDAYPVGEPNWRANTYCMTDQHGEFSCSGLVSGGEYDFTIGPGAPRSGSIRVTVPAGSAPHIVLHAHAAASIRARIENPTSFELAALVVTAKSQTGQTVLGELKGDELVFEPLALGSYEISTEPGVPGMGRRVELTRAGQVVELTLPLPAPQTLSGRVVDERGEGIPEAWVRASGVSPYAFSRSRTPVLTDAEGAFSFTGLLPGLHQLTVSSGQGEARLDGVASDDTGIVIRVPRYASLSGSLTSAAGDALSDFIVAYTRREDGLGSEVSGSRGVWQLPALTPGTYELTAKAPEGNGVQVVELRSGEERVVALRLDPAP